MKPTPSKFVSVTCTTPLEATQWLFAETLKHPCSNPSCAASNGVGYWVHEHARGFLCPVYLSVHTTNPRVKEGCAALLPQLEELKWSLCNCARCAISSSMQAVQREGCCMRATSCSLTLGYRNSDSSSKICSPNTTTPRMTASLLVLSTRSQLCRQIKGTTQVRSPDKQAVACNDKHTIYAVEAVPHLDVSRLTTTKLSTLVELGIRFASGYTHACKVSRGHRWQWELVSGGKGTGEWSWGSGWVPALLSPFPLHL